MNTYVSLDENEKVIQTNIYLVFTSNYFTALEVQSMFHSLQ